MPVLDTKGFTCKNHYFKISNHITELFFILSAHAENSFGCDRDVICYIGVGCFRIWLLLYFYTVSGKAMLLTTFRLERMD